MICFQDRTQTEINLYQPLIFTSEKGQVQDSETIETIDDSYRVIDGTENNWWEERQLRKHESSFSNLA